MIETIRYILAGLFITAGVLVFVFEVIGVFRFKYVLNRMHAAAMGDTAGIGLVLTGLIVLTGFSFTSLKLICVIAFLWLASPVASHMLAEFIYTVEEHPEEHFRTMDLKKKEDQ